EAVIRIATTEPLTAVPDMVSHDGQRRDRTGDATSARQRGIPASWTGGTWMVRGRSAFLIGPNPGPRRGIGRGVQSVEVSQAGRAASPVMFGHQAVRLGMIGMVAEDQARPSDPFLGTAMIEHPAGGAAAEVIVVGSPDQSLGQLGQLGVLATQLFGAESIG